MLLSEASHLRLITFSRVENTDLSVPAPHTDKESVEDSVAVKAQDSPLVEAHSKPAMEITNAKGLRTVIEMSLYSKNRSRKRKSRKKTALISAKKTPVCALHSHRSQQRECHGRGNHCENIYFPTFSNKSKHNVMHNAERLVKGFLIRGSIRLCNLCAA